MIKAFLFDYGGVVCQGGKGDEVSLRFAEKVGISHEEARDLLTPVWGDYSRGKLSETALWKTIEMKLGRTVTNNQRAIFNGWDIMYPMPEMLTLIADLKTKGYPVGLLSNTLPDTKSSIREHGGYDSFDFTILSCEVGYIKPEPEIYQLALAHLPGIVATEVLFLDDQERCLIPARKIGFATILVNDTNQAIAAVRALLS